MTTTRQIHVVDELTASIAASIAQSDVTALASLLMPLSASDLTPVLERLPRKPRAIAFRLLSKETATEVFDLLDPVLQRELLEGLHDAEVTRLFAQLEPDARTWLLEEVPAVLATRLLRGLPEDERALTAALLGYPQGSAGRRMTPEYVSVREDATVAVALQRVRDRIDDAETVYTIPILNDVRQVVGVVSLRDLLRAESESSTILVSQLMRAAQTGLATDDAEAVARRCADLALLALPVVDSEERLVGMLTIDDAMRILEHEESEDAARQGGTEPLRRPYLSTPVHTLVRSRVVWLLVLALGATLTVQVLEVFETTLEQVTVLALFVPLLIGTGGNTGNQAATTVTRALALGDVRARDVLLVLARELRVGAMLGLMLGALGFAIASLVYSLQIGSVIGLTLFALCTVAAAVGGTMPLLARAVKVDPAVFSNPFISTFVDASGLIIYFVIARAILQI